MAVHVAAGVGLRAEKVRRTAAPPENVVEFSLVEQRQTVKVPQPTAAKAEQPAVVREVVPPRVREHVQRSVRVREAAPPEQVQAASPEQVAAALPTQPEAPAVVADVSARRAVVGSYDELTRPPSCRAPASLSGDACVPEPRDRALGQRLNDSLSNSAHALAHLAPRKPPVLHREGDGGYRYDGHVFTAKIEPDGQVRFEDRPGVSVDGLSTFSIGIAGSFDLTDTIDRLRGKELYTAEKSWFLDQTSAVRAQLADAARVHERFTTHRYVERELERILASALDAAQKRAQVFAVWQDCGDDADSLDTRRVVENFVRLHMPKGSELAFTVEELARWNLARPGLHPFDPYRVPTAGSPG